MKPRIQFRYAKVCSGPRIELAEGTQMNRLLSLGLITLAAFLLSGCSAFYTPDKSRAELEAKYLNHPSDLVEVAETLLHVRDEGPKDAQTVILLHGVGSHLQTWDEWASALEQDFRIIRFDLPGAGLSPPAATDDYTDTRAVAIITALLDERGIERTALIGNSLGGRIAWTFAARYPERTDKLVLVSPDGFASPGFEYETQPRVPFALRLIEYSLPQWLLRRNLALAFSDTSKMSRARVQRYHDLIRAPGVRRALLDRMRQTVLQPPEPLLASITAPVLLVWGEDDRIIPFDNSTDYEAALRDVTVLPLPGIGHLPQEEAPTETVRPVIEFLSARSD